MRAVGKQMCRVKWDPRGSPSVELETRTSWPLLPIGSRGHPGRRRPHLCLMEETELTPRPNMFKQRCVNAVTQRGAAQPGAQPVTVLSGHVCLESHLWCCRKPPSPTGGHNWWRTIGKSGVREEICLSQVLGISGWDLVGNAFFLKVKGDDCWYLSEVVGSGWWETSDGTQGPYPEAKKSYPHIRPQPWPASFYFEISNNLELSHTWNKTLCFSVQNVIQQKELELKANSFHTSPFLILFGSSIVKKPIHEYGINCL